MRGLGTIINVLAIVASGVRGILFKRFLKECCQDTIIKATGFSVVLLGVAGTLAKMLAVGADGTFSVWRLHGHDLIAGVGRAVR